MAGSDLSGLVIGLGANTASLQSDFNTGAAMAQKFAADVSATISKIGSNANLSGISNQVQGLTSDFDKLKGVVASVFSVGLGIGGLKGLEDLADGYQNVSNRIRTTVSDTEQYAAVSQRVFDIAQQTSRSLDDTAKTYQRLEQAISATGVSQTEAQQQALSITKTLNEEIVVSGASAGEASRAIMDLVHGLAGGEIQARQFNQVMRQMPDLGKQIADGLGVSVEQLEKMVHAGLPAQTLLKALAEQAGDIDNKFNALPKTFAQTWSVLSNAVEKYVGQAAQGSVVTEALKSGIIAIANNIKFVAEGAEAVAAAMALWLGGKGLSALGSISSSIKDAVLAQGEYKTALQLTAEGEIAASEATIKATTATIARLDAENDLRVAKLGELQATQQSLISEQAELEARQRSLVVGVDVLATEERLIAVRTELAGTTTKIATLEDAMAASQARATLAEQAETGATVALAEAKTGLAAAQGAATSATGLLSRAGSALFTAIGGWTTVVLAAAAGIYYLSQAQTEAEKECDKLAAATKELNNAHAGITPTVEKTTEALYSEAAALQEATQQRILNLQAQLNSLSTQKAQPAALAAISDEMVRAQQESQRLTEYTGNLAAAYLKVRLVAGGKSIFEALFPDVRSGLAQIDALTDGIDKQDEHFQKLAATYGKGNLATVQWQKAQELAKITAGQGADAVKILSAALDEKYAKDLKDAAAADAAVASHKAYTKALTEQQRALRDVQSDSSKFTDMMTQLSSGLDGPYEAALRQYNNEIRFSTKYWNENVIAGTANKELAYQIGDAQDFADAKLQRTNEQIKAQHDAFALANTDLQLQVTLMGTATQNQAAVTAGQQAYNAALKAGVDLFGDAIPAGKQITDVLNEQLPAYIAVKQKINDLTQAQKLNEEAAKQWQSIWATAGNGIADTFSKILVEGGSLMKGLKDIAKQTVEAIISYFTKLAVINPILNAIFGGGMGGGLGYSMLPTLASTTFGGSSGGGLVGSLFGGSSSSSLFSSLGSTAGAGSGLMGFLFGSSGTAISVPGAAGTVATYYGNMPGTVAGTPGLFGSYGNTFQGIGTGLSIAGGVFAGLQEFKNAGGGAAGIAGGLAYGAGTYFAGAAATAALSGGLAAGLAAVPVIGWVAIGAMVLDKLTGGGLFGTAYKPTGNTGISISTDASGIDASATAEEKKKLSLFRGSKTKTVSIDVPSDTLNQLQQYFDTLNTGLQDFADQFKSTVTLSAQVLQSSFAQTFDKKGNVTSTTETINGQTYNDATAQDYEERLQALSFEKVITDMGISVAGFVNNAGAADDLLKQVQDVASAVQEANTNLAGGFKFMALASDQTLQEVVAFAEGLNQGGETLTQTYERLVQAQQQYDQFVAQFKPTTTYVDDFEGSLSGLYHQLLNAQAQANALAKAAGASGANVQDLTNITNAYAQQAAQLTLQLEASAQSLAFSLGLTTKGSLDQVTQEINELQSKANAGSTSVSNFGSAIHDTAQKASDAMNLLLGNLSPLNDQQKLQTALQGLRAGTVTSEQVLEIGRRLYASSEAYNTLFNQVKGVSSRSAGVNPFGGGSGTTSSSSSGLSAADQARLQTLLAEQQTLQAAQTLSQYQTLAQQIAEIASAKQESWQDVLKEMNVQASDLEKGLGLANDDALNAYVQNIQKQMDSAGDNTQSIVQAILDLPSAIAAALSGTLPAGSGSQGPYGYTQPTIGPAPSTPPGTGGNGTQQPPTSPSPTPTPANGNGSIESQVESGVAAAVAPVIARIDSSNRRGLRWAQPA